MYVYTCTHVGTSVYTHTCTHTHHDAWARVRTDNLAKDTGGDRACAHVGVPKPNCTLAAPLHYTTLTPHSHKHTTSAPLQHNEVLHTHMHTHAHNHAPP